MSTMNSEVKEKWIAELRSDQYKQGKYKLNTENKYCCLGVLCEVYKNTTHDGEWLNSNNDGYYKFAAGVFVENQYPPYPVHEWAELTMGMMMDLSNLNDRQDKSFSEIADYIEENL